jgi:hypothetical protein
MPTRSEILRRYPRLLSRTRYLLRRCELPTGELARRAGVGDPWLSKFRSEISGYNNPTVKNCQRLHDFLLRHLIATGKLDSSSNGDSDSGAPTIERREADSAAASTT